MKYILPFVIILILIIAYVLYTNTEGEPLGAIEPSVIEDTPEYRIINNGVTAEKIYK